ncbi:hypothetical protein ACOBQX_19880 [Actinokineospora sp. G85]|uniref:hypothetical protein n=1 Tax=Actinokineospora sp. G85 TaxID=3406626 RepID=UPI003C77D04E
MRCLLTAPAGLDLHVLLTVLRDQNVDVVHTSDLAAGAALADVAFDDLDFGVAIIAAGHAERGSGLAAVYMEIGVIAGRRLPMLVVVEPPELPSPALSGLTTVTTKIDNNEALRLHLGLFLHSVEAGPRPTSPLPSTGRASVGLAAYHGRLAAVRNAPRGQQGWAFEQLVSELLRDAGAQVEERSSDAGDYVVDMAAFVPGQEQHLGTVIVEVKSGKLTARQLREAQEQLSSYVSRSRSGLGVLVYNKVAFEPQQRPTTPLVVSLAIDELLTELEHRPLGEVLAQARNRSIHGM